MTEGATLYLHYPCFDGVISSVLAWEFLERQGWKFTKICPVGYGLRSSWPLKRLQAPCAIVDFLYHPDAQFWADHHLTTFVTPELRRDFEKRTDPWLFRDEHAGSCAAVLWRNLAGAVEERDRYQEMVNWADKVDSARYATVNEAILGDAPALQIYFSLTAGGSDSYCEFLIRALRTQSLSQAAQHPEVRTRFERVHAMLKAGLNRFQESVRLEEDGRVAFFDIEATEHDIVSRYAPFYYFPEARYSIGMIRYKDGAKITAMRNPWREFESVPLGPIFERHGGGGHVRVGSVIVPRQHSASNVLRQLLAAIQEAEQERVPALRDACE
jgi:hypothetical protein